MSVYGGEQPIVIDLNSYGGEVAGLSQIYNKIILIKSNCASGDFL